ncbi:5-(carboxyamino)imidazole ribonucleotide synthase [Salicibibacter halophilus]|uniref:N5-carboxyaminoimidazole ribonucleotide synthase n=1 Tax=Salicibibacter halophilus TaxID=2502791 RepID=A0A514LL86_9BACI|nr:5-(carboxyamino)imidazole ribonucleotide synthase [Salicibibacter halophilus]QDI92634.1 5-(carboxyamino)imidazole ribonucleotide synthase [Salicibibacter halophilus]
MMITPGKTIGILGGGQLGRMMALEAKAMGYRIAVLEPKSDAPTAQVADEEIVAAYDDEKAVRKLAKLSDVVTFEFENVDATTAAILAEEKKLPQGVDLLRTCQHRLREKEALSAAGLNVAPYAEITSAEDLRQGIGKLGTPAVLKTCRGGYDGKGQAVIRTEDEVLTAYEQLKDSGDLVLEQWVPFAKEISVIVTRTETGESVTFPVAENDHEDNILKRTVVPACMEEKAEQSAREMAETFAENISLVGTLAIEMFYLEDGGLYVNELAPRPHNSGHYSMDACNVSQFHLHIRAICGWPLLLPELTTPVVMDNVLGEHVETAIETIPHYRNAFLHLYGKAEARPGRKMGHVNVTGKTREEALANVKKLAIRS